MSLSVRLFLTKTAEEHPTLSGFLEEVALVADIDSLDESDNRVLLMTLHSAKGTGVPLCISGRHGGRTVPELYVYCSGQSDGRNRGRAETLLCGYYPCHERTDADLCQNAE